MAEVAGKHLRADARRNRDKILAAAARVLAEDGLEARLERIAAQACVGSATLYGNFPTRETLVEAAYRLEGADLCEAAATMLERKPFFAALHAWILFLDYATTKHGMIDALRAIAASGTNPYHNCREMIQAAPASPMGASAATWMIRTDFGMGSSSFSGRVGPHRDAGRHLARPALDDRPCSPAHRHEPRRTRTGDPTPPPSHRRARGADTRGCTLPARPLESGGR